MSAMKCNAKRRRQNAPKSSTNAQEEAGRDIAAAAAANAAASGLRAPILYDLNIIETGNELDSSQ